MFLKFLDDLNFIARCRKYNLGLWQCPNFLFLMMGILDDCGHVRHLFHLPPF